MKFLKNRRIVYIINNFILMELNSINDVNLSNDSKLIYIEKEKDPFQFKKEDVIIDISKIHSDLKLKIDKDNNNNVSSIKFSFHIWKYSNSYCIALSYNDINKIGSIFKFNYEVYQKDKLFENQIEDVMDDEEKGDLMNDFFNKAMNINTDIEENSENKSNNDINPTKVEQKEKEEEFNIIEEYYITQVLGKRNNELNSFFVTLLISELTNRKKIFEMDKKKTSIIVTTDFDIGNIIDSIGKSCLIDNIDDNLLKLYVFEHLVGIFSNIFVKNC